MSKSSRRTFIRQSALVGGVGLLSPFDWSKIWSQRRLMSANEKLQVGVIGCNGMGFSNLREHLRLPQVECIALADVDQSVLDRRTEETAQLQGGKKPMMFKDYRKMLENKDLDAVIIGTPDHWHCLALTNSLDAGKHVYVEKPLANSIQECQIMLNAARYHKKIVQVGQWQRSGRHYDQAIKFVQSGQLGNIRLVKCWAYQGWMKPVDVQADSTPPPGVDYDMWLGPATKRPFNANRFHFNFRWFWDYAGGLMTDWGVHEIDIALYAMKAKAPKSVMASGGILAYPNDASETPDTLQAVFEYDNFNMLWEHATGIDNGNYGKTEGIAFIGNLATLVLNRGGWSIIPEVETNADGIVEYELPDIPDQNRPGNANYLLDHVTNFVQAIHNNNPGSLKCGIETGSIAAVNAHMGNIAFKTGRKVYWDEAKQMFKNDEEANRMTRANYHNGWKLPNF